MSTKATTPRKEITTVSDAQWDAVRALRAYWVGPAQTAQYPDEVILATAREMLHDHPACQAPMYVVSSPTEALAIAKTFYPDSQKTSILLHYYCGLWRGAWAAWYEGAAILGVEYEDDVYQTFRRRSQHCPVWLWCDHGIYILRHPTTIHWNSARQLHNTSGPAVHYTDDFNLWSINGIAVDEQIVMRPETQTIKQLTNETNNDVLAIRIQRYGWDRYLDETHAVLLDSRENHVEGTLEALYTTTTHGLRFLATCPTGQIVCLSIPADITTCNQACQWLSATPMNVLGRT